MLLKITYMCYFIIILPVNATLQYEYISDKKTLSEAHDFCMKRGSKLSDLQENVTLVSQECSDDCIGEDLWTSASAAPYLSILGCFNLSRNPTFFDLNDTSVIDCQNWCYNATAFAVSNRRCSCIEDMVDIGETVNAALCNISCDGVYCGGNDVMNVYVTVGAEFFDNKALQTKTTDGSSCITNQCVDGFQLFKETDCNATERIDATCSTFFSCTFEPGESCFLFQKESDKIKWTITKEKPEFGPETAYQGSYFAFVNDSNFKSLTAETATLISNVKINAKYGNLWCLRFRYQLPNENTFATLKVILKSTSEHRKTIQAFDFGKFREWNYTELQINLSKLGEAYILFEFTSGTKATHLALDDVTLTQGLCVDTLAEVLKMTGNLKCGFEGNQSVCFNQSGDDNFDWTIKREASNQTGPPEKHEGNYYSFIDSSGRGRSKGHQAVLTTKFRLDNENITFSMYYLMDGKEIRTLKVYLDNQTDVFLEMGNQGKKWRYFNTSTILGSQYLHISANISGAKSDIAIDDIQFRINKIASDTTWWSSSQRCVRDVRSYPIPHTQFGSTRCISYDRTSRWTGIVRPWQPLKGRYLGVGNPSDVLVYKSSTMTYVWEKFNSSGTKSFFCESEKQEKGTFPYQITSVANQTNEENGTLIGGLVAGGVVILLIGIILIIVIKRKKNQRKIENVGINNMVYEKIDDDVIGTEDGNSNGNQQQRKEGVDRNKSSSEVLDNSDQGMEGEYNHLTFKQEATTSANDVYSHVTDNQYGLHPVQKQEDDTYDHSAGPVDNGDYGTPNVMESPDLYDHAPGTEYSSLHEIPDAATRNNIEGSDTYAHTLDTLYSSANQRVQN
uniref:Uncharacterized protein LOC111129644 isoform X2 n=1 Tax=Crassostrea virginica TaxID=6565 RepID=A0A8B8DW15_CRAVI|nr:uncharacterized protein LOC111129644 isoform X2 [Crassostrea virginica]